MSATSYDGKVVFVVGGSTGIGLAAAEAFVSRGAHVLVFARRPEPLAAARASLEARRGDARQRVEACTLDVRDDARVATVMREAVASFGPPDVLLNCAGRALPDYFERITTARLRETLEVNLVGTWNTVHALLPELKARRGYVVNTSSVAGLIGVIGFTDYSASKFAVIGFSEALRSELKPHGVRVSVLCPPDTDTPGFAEENRTKPPETHAVSSAARCLAPAEVADALLRGMDRKTFLIVPGWDARFSVLAKRVAPGLVDWVVDRKIAQVSKAAGADGRAPSSATSGDATRDPSGGRGTPR